jgi:hypothetical protein
VWWSTFSGGTVGAGKEVVTAGKAVVDGNDGSEQQHHPESKKKKKEPRKERE